MIEIKGEYKESTKKLYYDMLNKIGVSSIIDLQNHDLIVSRIESLSSDHYKLMAYRAIHSILDSDLIYNAKYRELQNNIMDKKDNIGKLPMTLEELKSIEVKCSNSLQQLVESFTIWINTHYPLRLDYYNVEINPPEKENCINYMTWSDSVLKFYLNDFKNSRSFGSQLLIYYDSIIGDYIQALTLHFGHTPKYLLYRYDKPTGTLMPFSSRIMYGGYLQDLFKRHTGHHITMNTIRKIHESSLIQSPEYVNMSLKDRKIKHSRLLHSLATAHESYNIVNTN
jgi:hypothetical protein